MAKDAGSSAELARVAKECAGYYGNHRRRMDYPRYRRLGLCSSSAPVESMCKHIVGKRLKGSGRRWNLINANAIASLRCTYENGEEDGYFERTRLASIEKLVKLRDLEPATGQLPLMLDAA